MKCSCPVKARVLALLQNIFKFHETFYTFEINAIKKHRHRRRELRGGDGDVELAVAAIRW
jgi:hypothetical protein